MRFGGAGGCHRRVCDNPLKNPSHRCTGHLHRQLCAPEINTGLCIRVPGGETDRKATFLCPAGSGPGCIFSRSPELHLHTLYLFGPPVSVPDDFNFPFRRALPDGNGLTYRLQYVGWDLCFSAWDANPGKSAPPKGKRGFRCVAFASETLIHSSELPGRSLRPLVKAEVNLTPKERVCK